MDLKEVLELVDWTVSLENLVHKVFVELMDRRETLGRRVAPGRLEDVESQVSLDQPDFEEFQDTLDLVDRLDLLA